MLDSFRLARYEPPTVITDSRHWTVLRSPASVGDVTGFYAAELTRCGWQITSSVETGIAATVVARPGPHGATISINHIGPSTAITIACYWSTGKRNPDTGPDDKFGC
jgi:hypothetical protein